MSEVVALHSGRMTETEYEQERAKLPADKKEAGARFEQALAILFYRSGWTQQQLADKETAFTRKKIGQQYISRLLRFGRFLNFTPVGVNPDLGPRNLTEYKFREYWEQTNKDHNERARFSEVVRAIQRDAAIVKPRRPLIGHGIISEFADGKWHSLQTIIEAIAPDDPQQVEATVERMRKVNSYGAKCEKKQVGTEFHYRIFHSEKQISALELIEKLRPIIQKLKIEGKKNMATMSPPSVAILAGQLEKLLEEWTQ